MVQGYQYKLNCLRITENYIRSISGTNGTSNELVRFEVQYDTNRRVMARAPQEIDVLAVLDLRSPCSRHLSCRGRPSFRSWPS